MPRTRRRSRKPRRRPNRASAEHPRPVKTLEPEKCSAASIRPSRAFRGHPSRATLSAVRLSTIIPLAALAGLALPLGIGFGAARADGFATRADIIPVEKIKKGMKGYGLTVFAGTTPEKFGVEVI